MTPSQNRKRSTTTSSDSSTDSDHNAASSSDTPSQVLLKALQEFIIPLIQAVDRKTANGVKQIPKLGPEADKLVTALQEFISSIAVRSHSPVARKVIEVALDDELQDDTDSDNDGTDDELSQESSPSGASSSESDEGETSDSSSEDKNLSKELKQKFHNKLFGTLRNHVDNKIPIRLLSFQQQGPKLQITLLDRSAICNRLESALKASMLQPGFRLASKFIKFEDGSMEPDEDDIDDLVKQSTRYAILSHTWLRSPTSAEVSYSNWNNGLYDTEGLGYQKLVNFCKTAWKTHDVAFGWMDTICINKDSSSELDESIRSMYNWYSRAHVCITYLAETKKLSDMHNDPWFTRGWTFQELIAPRTIIFYDSDWKKLGENSDGNDRKDTNITKQIEQATTITKDELHNIHDAPISRRMQLAATRKVTREEDTAYSLMGIFNVSISTAYGEGADRAFFRLLQGILVSSTTNILDIFNWAGKVPSTREHVSTILPTSPHYYLRRSTEPGLSLGPMWPSEPLTLTPQGLRIPVILMPGILSKGKKSNSQPVGDYFATVKVSFFTADTTGLSSTYAVLAKGVSGSDYEHQNGSQRTFAVFNFDGNPAVISISKTCIAMLLKCSENIGKVSPLGEKTKIRTKEPIVFKLKTTDSSENNDDDDYYRIKPENLAAHGMQLVSLYL